MMYLSEKQEESSMKCRFCGKKLRKNDAYCSACGKPRFEQAPDEDEILDAYQSDFDAVEDSSDFSFSAAPTGRRKKKKPLLPVILGGIALVVAAVMAVTMIGSLGDSSTGKKNKDKDRDKTKETTESRNEPKEYDLLWPDLRSYLGEGNYALITETSRLTHDSGATGFIYEIWIPADRMALLEGYLELVEDSHFKLEREKDGTYYYRFLGANAPDPVEGGVADYHCRVSIVQELAGGYVIRCVWMDPFELDVPGKTDNPPVTPETDPPKEETKPPQETVPKETEGRNPAKPSNSMALPDPTKFFGCGVGENQKHEDNGWMVSCKFDLDTGREVVSEFLRVLESGNYPLEFICAEKADYIRSSAQLFTYYYFDYTGNNSQVKGLECEHSQTKQMVHYDVRLAVYYNYRAGWIMVSFYYDEAFSLKDYGERASRLPTDYTNASQETLDSLDRGSNWNKDVLTCTACDGDGDCSRCNGDGYLWSSASDKENRNCWSCNNSGICQTCYGTGKR